MPSIIPAAAALMLAGLSASATQAADLTVTVDGARSAKGVVSLCLFSEAAAFPDCGSAPSAFRKTVAAADLGQPIVFTDLQPGVFALAVLHDENANGQLDTNLIGIPREGIAVSNNRIPRFSAPRFADAAFRVNGPAATSVSLVYW